MTETLGTQVICGSQPPLCGPTGGTEWGVHTLIQRRRYSYFIRKRVPPELVPIIGRREIVKSLGSLDVQEAESRAMRMALEVDRMLAAGATVGRSCAAPPGWWRTAPFLHDRQRRWIRPRLGHTATLSRVALI